MAASQPIHRVAVYARVSTAGQTPENQLLDLRKYEALRGWQVHREYIDHGVSGTKSSRPALDELMADARRRRFDVVLVARFDRFARSTTHLLSALDQFRTLAINFVSVHEAIDTTSALGQMVFTIIAAVAQLERELIRERVMAGLRRARSEGKRIGRPRAIVDLGRVKKLRAEGLSVRAIARTLDLRKSTVATILRSGCPRTPSKTGPVSR